MNMPRYGKPNVAYVSTWFSDPIDKPMWALNLMKYRPIADYQDGRDLHISGADADMLYNPTGPLAEVGGRGGGASAASSSTPSAVCSTASPTAPTS